MTNPQGVISALRLPECKFFWAPNFRSWLRLIIRELLLATAHRLNSSKLQTKVHNNNNNNTWYLYSAFQGTQSAKYILTWWTQWCSLCPDHYALELVVSKAEVKVKMICLPAAARSVSFCAQRKKKSQESHMTSINMFTASKEQLFCQYINLVTSIMLRWSTLTSGSDWSLTLHVSGVSDSSLLLQQSPSVFWMVMLSVVSDTRRWDDSARLLVLIRLYICWTLGSNPSRTKLMSLNK